MLNPLDVLARAAAIPAIVWEASTALLAVRHHDASDQDNAFGSRFAARFTEGFFEHIEERCRTRWADLFTTDEQDRRAA